MRTARRSTRPLWVGIAGSLAMMALVGVVIELSGVSEQYLPRLPEIVTTTLGLFGDGAFLDAVAHTVLVALLGLALATAVAVPAGIALGSSPLLAAGAGTLLDFIRPVPVIALIPIAIMLFGTGMTMEVLLVALGAVWVVLFHAVYAVRGVDPIAKESARVYGTGRAGVLLRVTLPSALPFIVTGVRVAASMALILSLSTGMLVGGSGGMGEWLLLHQAAGDQAAKVFAGAVFAGLLGLALNGLIRGFERRFFAWAMREQAR